MLVNLSTRVPLFDFLRSKSMREWFHKLANYYSRITPCSQSSRNKPRPGSLNRTPSSFSTWIINPNNPLRKRIGGKKVPTFLTNPMMLRSHEIRLQKETKILQKKKNQNKKRTCSHGDRTIKKSARERRRCVVVGEGRRETQGEFRSRWVWNCGVSYYYSSSYFIIIIVVVVIILAWVEVGPGAQPQGADRGRAKWSHAPTSSSGLVVPPPHGIQVVPTCTN